MNFIQFEYYGENKCLKSFISENILKVGLKVCI